MTISKNLIASLIVIVIVAVSAVAVASFALAPKTELRIDLSHSALNDWPGQPTRGTVYVTGTIHNDGDRMGIGTVEIIINGHIYRKTTGIVPANSSVDFHWSMVFDPLDTETIVVEYHLA